MTKRTDIHRPSAIIPEDYEFVALGYMGPGDYEAAAAERKVFMEHMQRTGGKFSGHEHGGTCHICGSVRCLYTVKFYHPKTNTYITTGTDCAEKLSMGDAIRFRSFREKIRAGIEAQAGNAKAQTILAEANLSAAWDVYTSGTDRGGHYEEATIGDMVNKLVRYGSLSEKQMAFIGNLLGKIERRTEMLAKRAEDTANAAPVPVTDQRIEITGTVLTIKEQKTDYGVFLKILVQHESGYKLWGTKPSGLDVERGNTVSFFAKIQPSKDDPKFGFFSRPTKAKVVKA